MEPLLLITSLLLANGMNGDIPGRGGVNPGDDDDAAILTLHAYQSQPGWNETGHCFLSVKNIKSSTITVGHQNLSSNNKLSIGTWPTSYHYGIHYNYENYDNGGWKSRPCATLSVTITDLGVSALNTILHNSSYNTWTISNTCASFASYVWNQLIPSTYYQVTVSWQPSVVYSSITSISGYSTTSVIPNNSNVGYVSASDTFVSIP